MIQGVLLGVTLAVLLYLRFSRRHTIEYLQPSPGGGPGAAGADGGTPETVLLTTLNPHLVIVLLLWILYAQQMVHFLDILSGEATSVASYLSGALMVVLFAHVLFVGLRGFYFNVRGRGAPSAEDEWRAR